jgi:AraC family transcriptional regulator
VSEEEFRGLIRKRREVTGLVLTEQGLPPGSSLATHSHENASLCIALKGSCTEVFGRSIYNHDVAGFHFLPAGNRHSVTVHEKGLRCLTIDVPAELLESGRQYSLILDTAVHAGGGNVALLLMKVYAEFLQTDSASNAAILGLSFEVLAEVSRRQVRVEGTGQLRWLNQAKEFLRAHFNEGVSLLRLSQAVGVHPSHLARAFRRQYHCTVGEYLRQLRIEHACRQLSSANSSLAEVSVAAGFADQSHFGRTFKRLVGMTPAQYRDSLSAR